MMLMADTGILDLAPASLETSVPLLVIKAAQNTDIPWRHYRHVRAYLHIAVCEEFQVGKLSREGLYV